MDQNNLLAVVTEAVAAAVASLQQEPEAGNQPQPSVSDGGDVVNGGIAVDQVSAPVSQNSIADNSNASVVSTANDAASNDSSDMTSGLSDFSDSDSIDSDTDLMCSAVAALTKMSQDKSSEKGKKVDDEDKKDDEGKSDAQTATSSSATMAKPSEQDDHKIIKRPGYLKNCKVCNERADYVCQGCYRTAYCSEEHQKENWSEHRQECIVYGLGRSPSLIYRGPCFVDAVRKIGKPVIYRLKANASLAPKQKILEEKPFLICPWPRLGTRQSERQIPPGVFIRNLSCFGCGKRLCFSWVQCPDCKLFLCSHNCLYIANHKDCECKMIQQLTPVAKSGGPAADPRLDLKAMYLNEDYREFLYMDIMILRLVAKFTAIRESMTPEEFAIEWARLNSLLKSTPLPPSSTANERYAKLVKNLDFYFKYSYAVLGGRKELLWKLFSILDMNSFPFDLPFRRFRVLCLVLTRAEHNCLPNTHAFLREPGSEKMNIGQLEEDPNDLTIVLQAACEIFGGEMLKMSYVPITYGTADRHVMLFSNHLIFCKCSRCKDPLECGTFALNIKCPTCQTAMLVPKTSVVDIQKPEMVTAQGNALIKPQWKCRHSCVCPSFQHDDCMSQLTGVDEKLVKIAVKNFAAIKDLLVRFTGKEGFFFESALVKLAEDVLRGTFYPLPDVMADDLNEYSDEALVAIVMLKNMYADFVRKLNPSFNFEGFPVANIELAENELFGRASGRKKWNDAMIQIIRKKRW